MNGAGMKLTSDNSKAEVEKPYIWSKYTQNESNGRGYRTSYGHRLTAILVGKRTCQGTFKKKDITNYDYRLLINPNHPTIKWAYNCHILLKRQ